MSLTTTLAPSAAYAIAMPRPKPELAPVTIATLPLSLSINPADMGQQRRKRKLTSNLVNRFVYLRSSAYKTIVRFTIARGDDNHSGRLGRKRSERLNRNFPVFDDQRVRRQDNPRLRFPREIC